MAVPSNDNRVDADLISVMPFAPTPFDTHEATSDPTAPGGTIGNHDVWWYYKPNADGQVTLSTAGSTYDTMLGVYICDEGVISLLYQPSTSGDRDPANDYVFNDDFNNTLQSQVIFDATADTDYYIAASGCCSPAESGDSGSYGTLVFTADGPDGHDHPTPTVCTPTTVPPPISEPGGGTKTTRPKATKVLVKELPYAVSSRMLGSPLLGTEHHDGRR